MNGKLKLCVLGLMLVLPSVGCRSTRSNGSNPMPESVTTPNPESRSPPDLSPRSSDSGAANTPQPPPESKPTEVASAGGVIEGNGGEHITNENNPWFLSGAPVRYCTSHDPAQFSLSREQADEAISLALSSWKQMFSSGSILNTFPAAFIVAKDKAVSLGLTFQKVACDQAHELEFQFGVKSKSVDDALQYSAKQVLALSIRDSYSDFTGQGTGRIWFASDMGPNRYKGPSQVSKFWSSNKNLQNIITHELGHVFGIRHTKGGFMTANFPANLIKYGMNAALGLDSLQADYSGCGTLFLNTSNVKDLSKTIKEVFDLDSKSIAKICVYHLIEPTLIRSSVYAEFYSLDFHLKNDETKTFEMLVTQARGGEIIEVGGQYLFQSPGQPPQYKPMQIAAFNGSSISFGKLNSNGRTYFTAIDSGAGGYTLLIGAEDHWQVLSVIKDGLESSEYFKIIQALESEETEPNHK
jgi:hypothetical protein